MYRKLTTKLIPHSPPPGCWWGGILNLVLGGSRYEPACFLKGDMVCAHRNPCLCLLTVPAGWRAGGQVKPQWVQAREVVPGLLFAFTCWLVGHTEAESLGSLHPVTSEASL